MLYSILITSYECHGKGSQYLRENLLNVFSQTYRPIQCIVSDHSKDNVIEDMIKTLDPRGVEFIYVKYSEHYGNPCHNWSNALKYSTGDYIHYFAMDDILPHENIVTNIVNFMRQTNSKWIAGSNIIINHNADFEPIRVTKPNVTAGDNPKYIPRWNDDILHKNFISGPSAVILDKSLKHIRLDPQLTWYLDVDLYYRLYKEAGPPVIFDDVVFLNRVHPYQLTRTTCSTEEYKLNEYNKLIAKYGNPLPKSP